MPKEDRLIVFDHTEVYKAVYSLCSQQGVKKPVQGVVERVFHPEGDVSRVVLTVYNEISGDERKEEYSRDFFAAALMLYCRGLGIPLPKNADKSVSIKDDEVMLRVRLGHKIGTA